jgi:hypothetical protein
VSDKPSEESGDEIKKMCDPPADVTVGRGSLSRDDKKDIKNGTSARSFTALSALFDVSLYFDWSDQTILNPNANPSATLRAALVDGRRRVFSFSRARHSTHERHHKMVMTFSANSYTTFCAFSGAFFGESIYCARIDEI